MPPPSNRGVPPPPSVTHTCPAPGRHFCCKRVRMRPESIGPSAHRAGLQHPSVPMRWHWSRSVGASPGQVLQLRFGGQSYLFWGANTTTTPPPPILRVRSPTFLTLAYLTQDWDFFPFWGPKRGVEQLIKGEDVGNQTNLRHWPCSESKQAGEHFALSLLVSSPCFYTLPVAEKLM